MLNFQKETAFEVTRRGYTVSAQDIARAYWRDRKQSSRGQYRPSLSSHEAAQYLILNGAAERTPQQ